MPGATPVVSHENTPTDEPGVDVASAVVSVALVVVAPVRLYEIVALLSESVALTVKETVSPTVTVGKAIGASITVGNACAEATLPPVQMTTKEKIATVPTSNERRIRDAVVILKDVK